MAMKWVEFQQKKKKNKEIEFLKHGAVTNINEKCNWRQKEIDLGDKYMEKI